MELASSRKPAGLSEHLDGKTLNKLQLYQVWHDVTSAVDRRSAVLAEGLDWANRKSQEPLKPLEVLTTHGSQSWKEMLPAGPAPVLLGRLRSGAQGTSEGNQSSWFKASEISGCV